MTGDVHNPFVPKRVPSPEELAAKAKLLQEELAAEKGQDQRLRA